MTQPLEIPLHGGRANLGGVVRIGDQVARPRHPQTEAVEHFLDFLARSEIDFVPVVIGSDDQGRQRLGYIEGRVAIAPYDDWAFDEALLVDVAVHQRRLHRVAQGYKPPGGPQGSSATGAVPRWAESAGDYFPATAKGQLVSHNDLCVSNIVCDLHATRVVGVIDFDYVAPVDRLFDIAVAARHWVPFDRPAMASGSRLGYGDLDRVGRFGAFCDAHDLDAGQRARVVALATDFLNLARANVAALAAAGRTGFVELIRAGYEADNRETVAWLVDNRLDLAATGR